MNNNKVIFSPIKLGNHNLQHRVVMAPLTRFRATLDAVPTDLMVEQYKQRATEGGLMITEATFITRLAGGYTRAPGIYTQEQINAWKKVTAAVHEKKATIFLQLWHVGRAGANRLNPNNEQVVSASDIAIRGNHMLMTGPYDKPHALTLDEIKAIVQDYRQAALNAMEAGFDGVEIHSGNGYLLDQFINTNSNKRTDIYGGSIANRTRFALEVLEAVISAVGAERTSIRLSPSTQFQDMGDEMPVETWSYLTSEIQSRFPTLAYLHFIEPRANMFDSSVNLIDSLCHYRSLFKGPFIVASGFSTAPEHAIDIAEKTGDLVAFGRAFVANPDLVERLRNGWELNKYDRNTFYTHDDVGYIDYPYYNEIK
ncbi:unnamed protein product [Mucor circinelloides]|uniref:NADH:flavin oxidoreductase/NADH oxidase N-terminal domain-containing protein n=1 Tax=Mucor circinelloides f. circinelloides (strain 1006PhL) TaxID=1220926 RepID=S2JUY1_MUCC1|nr:hypothetical protein HMPREF1544_00806 [Mucor circinelloides 1006PhL]